MDEKALKKLTQLIEILATMKAEDSKNIQGFNDRLGIAKNIYKRNKSDKEFIGNINHIVDDSNKEVYDLIIN